MFDELRFPWSLGSDNHAGVPPRIMEAIFAANRGHAHAYGLDELCRLADLEFARVFGPTVEAQYVFTGTAANVLSLATLTRPFEAVICSDVAHLNVAECGAPERFLGAKILPVPSQDGRIFPQQCATLLEHMGDQHFSQPKFVSLTLPSELGVCYTVEELREWRRFTREKNLMLHLDGTRLAHAAVHLKTDLRELTEGVGFDVISFGGTKNGLLGAEAVLLFHPEMRRSFKFHRKQALQLSSKTRFLAAQFYAYLKGDFWREMAEETARVTRELVDRLQAFPEIELAHPVQSNGIFLRLPKEWIKPLRDRFFFYILDSESRLCRWMISWDWTTERNDDLVAAIMEIRNAAR